MFVSNIMVEDVTTVSVDQTLQHAYDLIQSRNHDCLPVKDAAQKLVGIIQITDIYQACMEHGRQVALPMTIAQVMTAGVVSVSPQDLVETAAKLMVQKDVPMLPVVDDDKLVGVVSESDIFKAFADMLGVNSGTTRLTMLVPDGRGQLAHIAEVIRDAGVKITHVATWHSTIFQQQQIIVRVETDASRRLVELIESNGYKVIHVDVN